LEFKVGIEIVSPTNMGQKIIFLKEFKKFNQ
jgi:hypothetical protein